MTCGPNEIAKSLQPVRERSCFALGPDVQRTEVSGSTEWLQTSENNTQHDLPESTRNWTECEQKP